MPDTGYFVGEMPSSRLYDGTNVILALHDLSTIQILDAIKDDEYYKYLIPLLVPAGLVAVIINWGGLHYFRHA
jgi:hypothetical protein